MPDRGAGPAPPAATLRVSDPALRLAVRFREKRRHDLFDTRALAPRAAHRMRLAVLLDVLGDLPDVLAVAALILVMRHDDTSFDRMSVWAARGALHPRKNGPVRQPAGGD